MRSFNKLFVIALPRCATVSMSEGLGELGVRLAHLGKIFGEDVPPHNDPERLAEMHRQIAAGDYDLEILQHCDGLVDYPACIPAVYQRLDRQFPNSLFINVRRDRNVDAWLRSVERQFVGLQLIKTGHAASDAERRFMQVMRSFRGSTFGKADFDVEHYRRAYHDHQSRVRDYFRDRSEDLLDVADLSVLEHDGFQMLGEFLQCKTPHGSFPRVNDHSDAPRDAFMEAVREGRIQSQTGIEIEM